jgi:Zn-dependent metalloprotease
MPSKGLTSFAFHVDDVSGPALMRAAAAGPLHGVAAPDLTASSPEDAARFYLQESLASPDLPGFSIAPMASPDVDFEVEASEDVPLTRSHIVRFRQHVKDVPVYGSVVSVELDQRNGLVSLSSALGTPTSVDLEPRLSREEAAQAIARAAGIPALAEDVDMSLRVYFDPGQDAWRLAYVAEDVVAAYEEPPPAGAEAPAHHHAPLPPVFDFVLDAHSGNLIAKLPRTASVGTAETATAADEIGVDRDITVLTMDAGFRLHDTLLNLHTHDLGFQDVTSSGVLPGPYIVNPPAWTRAAVSAHANAAVVARFVRDVLMRNGINNLGGRYVSSVNCLYRQVVGQVWRNAAWYRGQMVYGQRRQNGVLVSYAAALDVVAHEIFHGITNATARLEYVGETGALNESYSDIFGIIVSNWPEADFDLWNWEMGENLSETGIPIRNVKDPPARSQPDHMDGFLVVEPPFHDGNDYGGVHTNSGIHNKAAYNLMTSKDGGAFVFTPAGAAQLFYLGLLALGPTSLFADSRLAVANAGRTLFRDDPNRDLKLAAIDEAFEAVGIQVPGV